MAVAARALQSLAIVAALAALAAGCRHEDVRGDLLIRADRLFDGEGMIEPGAVLVGGDEIVAVGRELEAKADRVIELGDATILPGFIDLHVHLVDPGPKRRRVRRVAVEPVVEGGVTTARSLGEPIDTLRPPDEDAPLRLLAAGPIITAPGGYPIPDWGDSFALEVRGDARARAAVRDLARRGAAVIKVALEPTQDWPMLTPDEVAAIVDEAHAHDLRVTAHATGPYGTELALAGGVDELAHMPCGAIADQLLRELVEREVEVIATLHVLENRGTFINCPDPVPDAARFVALGGRLLYGSDNVPFPGGEYIDVEELRLLRRAGLEPETVLAAATSRAGEHIGRAPLGTLADGAPADVIAVQGDARELRDDLAEPVLVVRDGRLIVDPARPTRSD
jgi:imidazolonepropionase-like amidohydrolase